MFIKLEKLKSKSYLNIDKIITVEGRFKKIHIMKSPGKTIEVLSIDDKDSYSIKNTKNTSLDITFYLVTGILRIDFYKKCKKEFISDSVIVQLKPEQLISFKNNPKYSSNFDIKSQIYKISSLVNKKETISSVSKIKSCSTFKTRLGFLKMPIDFDKNKLKNLSEQLVNSNCISSEDVLKFLSMFIYSKDLRTDDNITWYMGENSLHLLFTKLYKDSKIPRNTWKIVLHTFKDACGNSYNYRTFVNKSKDKRSKTLTEYEKTTIDNIINSIS